MKKTEKYEDSYLYRLRHTAAHVLAMAALELDPEAKLAIGPAIEDGFYYDFQFSNEVSDEMLGLLEEKMAALIKQNLPVEQKKVDRQEAIKEARLKGQDYKVELMREINDNELTFYGIGNFWDLCKGPHIEKTGEIKAFKLLSVAGAYWRGDEHNPMLTRIYGTAFTSKDELKRYLIRLEEAKKYDHRRLGREMGIFAIMPEIGSGLPVWLPRGATLYRLLADYLRQIEIDAGYQHVITSELGKTELYKTSGHLEHYKDSMYPPLELDGESFMLRPMNCPHHISIFNHELRSYRELPFRIAEFGEVFRYEKSGELFGLQRVRSFTINDAHIFCREDQIKSEIKLVLAMIRQVYEKLGLKDYWLRLSLHDGGNTKKYATNLSLWRKSEDYLRQALKELKMDFTEAADEAAFYGPKIDVQIKNILGKEETLSTVQLDFYLPERFEMTYVNAEGKEERPVIIHRAIFGSMERFIGVYLEKTKGELPLWLSPTQLRVIPVSEKTADYSRKIYQEAASRGIRAELDEADETLGKRIREAELERLPLIAVIGEKEAAKGTLTLRRRGIAKQDELTLNEVAELIGRS